MKKGNNGNFLLGNSCGVRRAIFDVGQCFYDVVSAAYSDTVGGIINVDEKCVLL